MRVRRLRAILLIFIPAAAFFCDLVSLLLCEFGAAQPLMSPCREDACCLVSQRMLAALSPLISIPQVDDMLSLVYVAQDRSRH